MYSTSTPRRSSSWCTRVAMVLLPDPDRPVNHNTGAEVPVPVRGMERTGALTGR